MSTPPPPKKFPRILAMVGVVVVLLLIFDYFHPIFGGGARTITTPSGLQYIDQTVGTGPSPKPGQEVTVHYVGTLVDGSQFDSSRDRGQPFTFVIGQGQVIKGWDEGVMTMRVGGRRTLIVPPELGYGNSAAPGGKIPGNSTLNFDVELLGVK